MFSGGATDVSTEHCRVGCSRLWREKRARRRHLASHLTGVLSSQKRASTDHVICDPEVVVVPAVGEDVHVHRPQHGRQAVAVEPGHPPAADRAPREPGQRRGVLLRQQRRLHLGVDDSRTVELSRRGNICQSVSQSVSNISGSVHHLLKYSSFPMWVGWRGLIFLYKLQCLYYWLMAHGTNHNKTDGARTTTAVWLLVK